MENICQRKLRRRYSNANPPQQNREEKLKIQIGQKFAFCKTGKISRGEVFAKVVRNYKLFSCFD